MQRISKIDPDQLEGEARAIFERWSPGGKPLNIVLIYFRNVDLNRTWSYMATHLFLRNSLTDRQREIIVLRTSWQCASDYEFIQHVRIAREGSLLSEDEMIDLTSAKVSMNWNALELALIQSCDELLAGNGIRQQTWETMAASLSSAQLMDVVATAGGYTLNSMATNSFGVDIESNMKREDGLTPSKMGSAFRFIEAQGIDSSPSIARIEPADIAGLTDRAAKNAERHVASKARLPLLNTLANYPDIVKDWMPVIQHVDFDSTIAVADRLLVSLRTAARLGSDRNFAERAEAARSAALSEHLLEATVSKDADQSLEAPQSLLIKAVDELIDDMIISEATFTSLREHYSDEQIMDVVFGVSIETMISWMYNALGIQ